MEHAGVQLCLASEEESGMHSSTRIRCDWCCTVLLEFGQLVRDTTVHIYPSVFMANALAAFALNLVIMTSVLMQISVRLNISF